jgi:hypothetical protein
MAVFTFYILVIPLVICGITPPSLLSKRIPKIVDGVNLVLKLLIMGAYILTQLWAQVTSQNFQGGALTVCLLSKFCFIWMFLKLQNKYIFKIKKKYIFL